MNVSMAHSVYHRIHLMDSQNPHTLLIPPFSFSLSLDQSIIDLTNETQEELLNETHDDIEIVSQKLRNNDEPIVCKTTSKKRRLSSSPDIDILEISDSSARTKVNCRRRHNTQDIRCVLLCWFYDNNLLIRDESFLNLTSCFFK